MSAVPDPVRRALAVKVAMWRARYRWLRRRPDVGPGSEVLPYADAVTPVLWVVIVVSAIEVVVAHVVVPWEAVRLALDVAGSYGVLWTLGLLASLRTAPHAVDVAGLRVRRRSVEGSRTVHLHTDGPRRAVSVSVGASTQVDVELRTSRVLPLRRAGGQRVTEIRIAAEDPATLVRRLRAGMAAAPAR